MEAQNLASRRSRSKERVICGKQQRVASLYSVQYYEAKNSVVGKTGQISLTWEEVADLLVCIYMHSLASRVFPHQTGLTQTTEISILINHDNT